MNTDERLEQLLSQPLVPLIPAAVPRKRKSDRKFTIYMLQRNSGPVQLYVLPYGFRPDRADHPVRVLTAKFQIARQIRLSQEKFQEPVTLIFVSADNVFNVYKERLRWKHLRITGASPITSWRSWMHPDPEFLKHFINHKSGNQMSLVAPDTHA